LGWNPASEADIFGQSVEEDAVAVATGRVPR